jgi:sugar-specific transcriptional regulator TrmB
MSIVLNGHATKGMELLRRYGLTQYESKAYFALLLLGETSAGNLAVKGVIPQSKVYWVLKDLEVKGLVAVTNACPKRYVALPFEMYASRCIVSKKRQIDELMEGRKRLRQVLCELQPIVLKYAEIKVFEPSFRRGLPTHR